jgi:hypothetical protein
LKFAGIRLIFRNQISERLQGRWKLAAIYMVQPISNISTVIQEEWKGILHLEYTHFPNAFIAILHSSLAFVSIYWRCKSILNVNTLLNRSPNSEASVHFCVPSNIHHTIRIIYTGVIDTSEVCLTSRNKFFVRRTVLRTFYTANLGCHLE